MKTERKRFIQGLVVGVLMTVITLITVSLFLSGGIAVPGTGHGLAQPQQANIGPNLIVRVMGETEPKVMLVRGEETQAVTIPKDIVWSDLLVSEEAHSAFFLARQLVRGGYDYSGVIRLSLPQESEALSKHKVDIFLSEKDIANHLNVDRAWVNKLAEVSADGTRLVLDASFTDKTRTTGNSTYYTSKPFVYIVEEDKLEEIKP